MNSSAAARLCREHLLALGPHVDPSSLADVVWLGLQLALRGAALPDATVNIETSGSPHIVRKPGSMHTPDTRAQVEPISTDDKDSPDSMVALYPSYFTHPFGKVGASRINIPAGEPLPQRLSLERALKPFKRRLLSHQQRELDPIATAEASAEWQSITPVYRASQERWFEVEILAENSDAMHIWSATLLELQRMLARHGAFRRVRLWRYTIQNDALILSTANAAVAAPRILVDPQGRRLCWFVTTGTSSLWQHSALTDFVATLGRYGPTAIVQLMPYHTWPHTLLGDASEEAVAQFPGAPTASLWLRDPFTGELGRASDALTVPVTSLEPERLQAWARFAMASRRLPHPAIRLQTVPQVPIPSVVVPVEEALPRQRIAAFRAIASLPAFQLMRLLSGMPLSLPVMRLMQMGMPDRAQVHLAEVLLSGLIERITPPDANMQADLVEYDFLPGIREELRDSLTLSEGNLIGSSVSQIAEQARRFVEAYTGATASFPALMRNPIGNERLLEQAKSFLDVSQNFRPVRIKNIPQPGVHDGIAAPPASSPPVRPTARFAFLSEEGVREHVLHAGIVVLGMSELRCLLFFVSDTQHTWLVVSDHVMALILDDAGTKRDDRLVQRTSSWLDALPIKAEHDLKGRTVVKFGTSEMPGWYYSPSLFSSPGILEESIAAMVPGGRDGKLMRLRGLALEYDEIRANIQPSLIRTSAMQKIVERIAVLPLLLEPDVTLASQSKSAGIQLIAIIALQRSFDPAYMDWLFDCIVGDQAFLALQAAVALQRAALALSKEEQVRMHVMAVNSKHKLQAAGLNDINVHRLLEEFATLPGVRRSSINGEETKRILIGSTGWELVDYRARAVQLLGNLGHDIVGETVLESVSELQTRLNQFETCDLVLLLIGTRNEYGQADRQSDPNKILLVELEYREAIRLRKQIMVFMLKNESFSDSSYKGKSDPMMRFRQMLLSKHIVKIVDSVKEFEELLCRTLQEYSVTAPHMAEEVIQIPISGLDNTLSNTLPLVDRGSSTFAESDNIEKIDESALVDALGRLVKTGAVPDFQVKIELALDHALESAQWIVDAQSYLFYEPDDEYAQLLRWEFAAPRPDVFELLKYEDGTLFVSSTIVAWVEVHCSFNFSVKDGVDKDMVPIGYAKASRTEKVEVGVEMGVRGVQEGFPEVESVEFESISKHVDFGNIEPDSYDSISDD